MLISSIYYTYDANGNLTKLNRYDQNGNLMDNLTYSYPAGNNRLDTVTDVVATAYPKDLEEVNTYLYDANGNMRNDGERIIEWDTYGKVKAITSIASGKPAIKFLYDAHGNRVRKLSHYSTGADTATYYLRDAQGNTMSAYDGKRLNGNTAWSFTQSELSLYGSDRLGTYNPDFDIPNAITARFIDTASVSDTLHRFVARKSFELKDHLGNVRAVVNDQKASFVSVAANGSGPDSTLTLNLTAKLLSSNNYYPFGMEEPGSGVNVKNYRYGYNGQERLNEINGEGNHNTALFWEYDTRLGRRWNQDPKPNPYISNYATFSNNPILYNDILGDEVDITHKKGFLGLGKSETLKYENGQLFNKDGSAYTGKVKGFLKQSVNALNDINKSEIGSSMLSELQDSKNVFNIQKGNENGFDVAKSDMTKAYARQYATDPDGKAAFDSFTASGQDFTGGAGGTIRFNPYNGSVWEQGGNSVNRPSVSLAHELFHGQDANRGLMDSRAHLGISRNEWQASYRENTMRLQMGLPLRTHYKSTYDRSAPAGPNLLDNSNKPIKPSW